ncbi:response regulator [Cohnella suwonensis]|uniref:Response regulator n=1 Tax=Cohnella suwonensis TaxID=696072 RepID=A0ABW0M110_9BACL
MYRVLLADDEPLVLEGLRLMVDWQGHGFTICGEACDGEDAFELIRRLDPDLVVTDVRMPVVDGLQLIENCAKMQLRATFIILSGHDEFEYIRQALRYAVRNYWLKPIDTDEIHGTLAELRKEWEAGRQAAEPMLRDEKEGRVKEREKELSTAIESHDFSRIDAAAERLLRLVKRSIPESEFRAYMSNRIVDLIRGMTERETSDEKSEDVFLHSSMFSDSEESVWHEHVKSLCREAAANLAARRLKTGAAGEAARYVRLHYRMPLKLQDVARELYIQPAYLGQLFKKTVGMSFIDYVHYIRILEAQKMLRRTDLKIAQVARNVGYSDPELFTAKFKQFTNTLPSQYKIAD